MVIDIIGAPGSGKTTICYRIIRELQNKSVPYIDMTGRKDTPIWMKLYIRACMLWVKISPKYRRMYKDIECRLASYPRTTEKFFHSDRSKIMQDVVCHVFAHRLYEGKRTILLNDEGILHKMLPITIQHDVPIDLLFDIYKSFHLDLQLIYVKSNIDQVFCNSRSRNRHDCDYDEMNDEVLRSYLEDYFAVLNQVLKREKYVISEINGNSINFKMN